MPKITIALLLLVYASATYADTASSLMPAREEAEEKRVLICQNAEGMYFVKPSGILYILHGLNGAPNCLAVVDTEGKDHVICHVAGSKDTCELSEPEEV